MTSESATSPAKESFKKGDYSEAAKLYKLAIAADTSRSSVYFCNLSGAYLKLKRFKDAESAAHTALIREPKSIKARYRRAVARREQGHNLEALVDLSSLLAVSPGNAQALAVFQEISDELLLAGGTRRLCFHQIIDADYPPTSAPPVVVTTSLPMPIALPPSIEGPGSGFISSGHLCICQTCKSVKRRQKMRQCAACGNAMYCDKVCQRANWPEHKNKCTRSVDNHRTLQLARKLLDCEYFADLFTIYCVRSAGYAEGTFPAHPPARVLSIIVDMVPISTSSSSQGKRLRVKHLTAVPLAVLGEELVLSYNTMFAQMRATYPDMPLVCLCITAHSVHGQGEDPRFDMDMDAVTPQLASPDFRGLMRSVSCNSNRLVTPDLDLLYSLIEEELARDDHNYYGMRDLE
ncbi:hypothetical protein B0H16DRAFT_1729463 [Mycena metata]|uniref:MYND-type domain-containing protein n=1 Tax=Mycena metata TaxID=1033252 RepID=A0AAD7IDC9_9AGAR|nr:hypothetical protein B0H16DRAFT_1729463 [Mycena metata]